MAQGRVVAARVRCRRRERGRHLLEDMIGKVWSVYEMQKGSSSHLGRKYLVGSTAADSIPRTGLRGLGEERVQLAGWSVATQPAIALAADVVVVVAAASAYRSKKWARESERGGDW